MSGVPFQRLTATSGDEAARYTNQQQQNTEDALRQVFSQSPIAAGVLIQGVRYANNTITFAHKLERKPLGYIITKSTSAVFTAFAEADARTLTLSATGTGTMDVWVF